MFTPPVTPVTFRGSVWGPASSYWWVLAAAAVIGWALARSSPIALLWALGALTVLSLVVAYTAIGTSITVGPDELIVKRRWRPTWRVPMREFRYVVENIPQRPRAPSLAGWKFHTMTGVGASVELAMFSPLDRRGLRKLFGDVVVDADAGMRRW